MFFKTFNSCISCLKIFNYAFLLSQAAFVFNHGFCSLQMEQNLMGGVNTTGNFHLLSSSVALLRYCTVLYRYWSFMYSCWWFVNIGNCLKIFLTARLSNLTFFTKPWKSVLKSQWKLQVNAKRFIFLLMRLANMV